MTDPSMAELYSLETHDGSKLFAPTSEVIFPILGGLGMPDINYLTSRKFRQEGETEVDFLLDPRTIDFGFRRGPACSRQEWWDNRTAILEIFRYNRGGPLKLTIIQPGGVQRFIYAWPDPGPLLSTIPEDNAWAVEDRIQMICPDPVWYGYEEVNIVVSILADDHLIFPIEFPIQFGPSEFRAATDLFEYEGTWVTYPTITVHGPYTSVQMSNYATGAEISLINPIGAGEERILTLSPGNRRIVDENGVDKFEDLDSLSNLIDFGIYPYPFTESGLNQISIIAFGALEGTTSLTIQFYPRYIGI